MKKIMILILASLLAISALVACTPKEDSNVEKDVEKGYMVDFL